MKNVTVVTLCRGLKLTVCLLLTVLFLQAPVVNAQESPLILVLSAEESESYIQARKAFEEHLRQNFRGAEFLYHHIEKGAKKTSSQILSRTMGQRPAAVFSLGSRAAEFAQTVMPDYPLVATMIVKDNALQRKTNYTGILLHFPAEIQLHWLGKFLPQAKRVGILYDPALNSDWVEEAENAAQKTGIKIIALEVSTPKQLKSALKHISKNADVLLAIPDKTVYSGKTSKQVLLFTYRNRIPFVGLSAPWVKAGALYALGVDYRDLGRQAAELIKKNLDGVPPKASIFHPEKVAYTVNSRIKDYLHLEIDPGLIKGASRVYE